MGQDFCDMQYQLSMGPPQRASLPKLIGEKVGSGECLECHNTRQVDARVTLLGIESLHSLPRMRFQTMQHVSMITSVAISRMPYTKVVRGKGNISNESIRDRKFALFIKKASLLNNTSVTMISSVSASKMA